jgi:hypothetical protein
VPPLKIISLATALVALLTFSIWSKVSERGVDLEDRNYKFQYRVFFSPQELLETCVENFSDTACRNRVTSFILGPRERRAPITGPLSDLPNGLNNMVAFGKEGGSSYCSVEDRTALQSMISASGSARDVTTVIAVPPAYFHCFTLASREARETRKFFLLKARNSIVGLINCMTLSYVPDPICSLDVYPVNGRYKITISSVPLKNIRSFASRVPEMVEKFLSRGPVRFPDDFYWKPLPTEVFFTDPTLITLRNIEEQIQ